MGLRVVCQVVVEDARVSFTWSDGPASSFDPYELKGFAFKGFSKNASDARRTLHDLVERSNASDVAGTWDCLFKLAESGFALYQGIFSTAPSEIEPWLTEATRIDDVESLEIVVDAKSQPARESFKVPWNVVYRTKPEKSSFVEGATDDPLRHFWGRAYNLAIGIRADPLRRKPRLENPNVLFVVDADTAKEMTTEAQARLTAFIATGQFPEAHTRAELVERLQNHPDLIYWFSHATPEHLYLADERLSAQDLYDLLYTAGATARGGLAFLNACQTAEVSSGESAYLSAVTECGMSGIVGTEQETIDHYANEFGLEFMQRFLAGQGPVAAILRDLRASNPLGLLYATYCPPHISVSSPKGGGAAAPPSAPASAKLTQPGSLLGGVATAGAQQTARPEPLPPTPYLALAAYSKRHRALFVGRRQDSDRFTAILNAPATRLLILQGASGVGKTSFLQAEVIPFLEEESIGYQFLRSRADPSREGADGPDSGVIFVRAGNDLVAELGQALWDFVAIPYPLRRPTGEQVELDLGSIARREGEFDSAATLIERIRSEPAVVPTILKAVTAVLPFAVVIIVDQAEEIFTQDQGPAAPAVLRALAEATEGDYKVIVSLRTEYYGRIVDALRVSRRRVDTVREYLLTDFSRDQLVEAIVQPTVNRSIPYTLEIPREKYHFFYAPDLAQHIAAEVQQYASRSVDSVLPLIQVICTQLFDLLGPIGDVDREITRQHFDSIGGVRGGMVRHVDQLLRSLFPSDKDRFAMQHLLSRLFVQQPDGALTTGLVPEEDLAREWSGEASYAAAIETASKAEYRLLKRVALQDAARQLDGIGRRVYLSLGHDSLARVAQVWKVDEERRNASRSRRRKEIAAALVSALIIGVLSLAWWSTSRAKTRTEEAQRQAEDALKLVKSRELATKAQLLLPTSPDLAVLLALEASQRSDDADTRNGLLTVLETEPRLRKILSPGVGGICHTAFSTDGGLIAMFGCRGDLVVVDARTGAVRTRIGTGKTGALAVGFLAGDRTVAVGFRDGLIRSWNIDAKAEAAECRVAPPPKESNEPMHPPGHFRVLRFFPDGTGAAFVEASTTVAMWKLPDCSQNRPLAFKAPVRELAFSPDGKRAVSGGHDGSVSAMDVTTGRILVTSPPIFVTKGDDAEIVTSVAFSHPGDRVVVTYFDGSMKSIAIGGAATTFSTRASSPTAAVYNARGTVVGVANSWRGSIEVFDRETKAEARPMEGHSGGVTSLISSPDGSLVLSASHSGESAMLWDLDAVCRLCAHVPGVSSVVTAALGPGGLLYYVPAAAPAVAPAPRAGQTVNQSELEIKVWNGSDVKTFGVGSTTLEMVPVRNAGRLVVADSKGVRILDANTAREIDQVVALKDQDNRIERIAADDSARVVAFSYGALGDTNRVGVWNGTTRVVSREFSDIIALRVTPDGRQVVVADRSGEVTFWSVDTLTEAFPAFTGHLRYHLWKRGALSRDVRFFVEGEDNAFRLWDLRTGRQVGLPVTGHTSSSYIFTFSDDNRLLASADEEGGIRLWSVDTLQQVGPVLRTRNGTLALQFSPSGDRLLSKSGELYVWNLSPEFWRETARSLVNRELSAKEREIYLGSEPR